jgi:hypothetical protein
MVSGNCGRSVQSSLWDEAISPVIPGTSCLATIALSLRDKSDSPIEVPHIILALMGLKPGLDSSAPAAFGAIKHPKSFAAFCAILDVLCTDC